MLESPIEERASSLDVEQGRGFFFLVESLLMFEAPRLIS